MNYIDYENWAAEYKEQVEILNRMLEGRSQRKVFASCDERKDFERATRLLYGMRNDCIRTQAILEQKAKAIKETELNDQDFVA